MKLRNKKTGEIVEWFNNTDGVFPNSLAELNAEWEDYKEPKEYWYLNPSGEIRRTEDDGVKFDRYHKEIGNYFSSREEAEKAVEKLKAWKRLKDKGFRFNGWSGTQMGSDISYIREIYYEGCTDDMDLLFGGEE